MAVKTFLLTLCIVSLLLPATSAAGVPDFPTLAKMLTEGTLDKDQVHSIMSDIVSKQTVMQLPADGITPEDNYTNFLCYYIAFTAIIDFIDCLVYYDFDSNCRSAIIYALVFYYLC